jgi:hypothetical protein
VRDVLRNNRYHFFEIALVLVRFNHVATLIVNAAKFNKSDIRYSFVTKMLDPLQTEVHDRPAVTPRYGVDQSDNRESSRFCVYGRLCCSVRFAGNQGRQRSA